MITGSLAMLLLAPSAAWAGSRDYNSDHRHASNHYRAQFDPSYRHDASCKHKHHGKGRGHQKHHVDYYCRACNHYFGARAKFYDHVAYRHRVPYQNLEVAVSFGEFGWIFVGR